MWVEVVSDTDPSVIHYKNITELMKQASHSNTCMGLLLKRSKAIHKACDSTVVTRHP